MSEQYVIHVWWKVAEDGLGGGWESSSSGQTVVTIHSSEGTSGCGCGCGNKWVVCSSRRRSEQAASGTVGRQSGGQYLSATEVVGSRCVSCRCRLWVVRSS